MQTPPVNTDPAARMDPSGATFTIASAGARAVVCEVGAALAGAEIGGVARTEPFPATVRPPMGAGAVLAPWPNRVRGGRWTRGGAVHRLALTEPGAGNAIHGLLRHVPWTVVESAVDRVTLAAVATVQPGWPQPVRVAVTYTVDDAGLTVTTQASNVGDAPVPFGIGFHPYLRVGDVPAADLRLTLSATERIPLVDQLPAGPARPDAVRDVALRGLELDDAFGGCVPDDDGVVRHRVVAPDGTGTELWADPAFGWVQVFSPAEFPRRGPDGVPVPAPAIAVEPMTCPPDALNSGDGLIELAAGESRVLRWGLVAIG